MRRVRTIHAMRLVAAPVAAAAVFLTALWGVGRAVWVAKVFENMPALSDLPAVSSFYFHAFLGTGILEQALLLTATAALIAFLTSVIRTSGQEMRFA
ncbi:MAG TPA: hypothetical protein VGE53_03245 [Candidatus Paceibacterota bacterium]